MTEEPKTTEEYIINVIGTDNNDISTIEIEKKEEEPVKKKIGRPRKPKPPPKERKLSLWQEDRNAYYVKYYHDKLMGEYICPICNRKLNSRNSLQKHAKINKSCIILQLKSQLNENNNTKEEGNKTDE